MDKSTGIVIVLFGLALVGAYSIYQPFLLSIVVATLMVMATFNLTKFFVDKLRSSKGATLVMVALMIMLILAPIVYVATTGVEYFAQLDQATIQLIVTKAKELVKDIPYVNAWANEYLSGEKISLYLKEISLYATKMGSVGLGFLKDVVLVIMFYAIINYYSERFFALLQSLIPVSQAKSSQMISDISSTMEVVFYSIIVTAIFEGLLFGIFISYFGFNGLLFGVIYGFASLIPIIGGAIVWVPLSLYAWSEIDSNTAIIIALYSVIMISVVADTFIKPIIIKVIKVDLLKNSTSINEFLIFFSILAGMGSYGFWGAIVGPAITTFLVATSKIYIEYNQAEREREVRANNGL